MSEETASAGRITKDQLILAQLKGKHEAIGRHDAILWRVRSGYVAVLYGSLLLFAGKEGGLVPLLEKLVLVWTAITTALVSNSILACMDVGFRFRQPKVVAAYDRLSDLASALAAGGEARDDETRRLLHITGESDSPIGWLKCTRAVVLIGSLYLASPPLAFAAYAVVRGAVWG